MIWQWLHMPGHGFSCDQGERLVLAGGGAGGIGGIGGGIAIGPLLWTDKAVLLGFGGVFAGTEPFRQSAALVTQDCLLRLAQLIIGVPLVIK